LLARSTGAWLTSSTIYPRTFIFQFYLFLLVKSWTSNPITFRDGRSTFISKTSRMDTWRTKPPKGASASKTCGLSFPHEPC
jgi:hypothetical protein